MGLIRLDYRGCNKMDLESWTKRKKRKRETGERKEKEREEGREEGKEEERGQETKKIYFQGPIQSNSL